MTLMSFLLLPFVGIAASAATGDVICVGNTTCVNHEVCVMTGCECPSMYYGAKCEFSVTNALIIIMICTFPPLSWITVCCYGVHAKNISKRVRRALEDRSNTSESNENPQQEEIDDGPPPTYSQVLQNDTTGMYESIELAVLTPPRGAGTESPPSYDEWIWKAQCLAHQERCADVEGGGIVAISGNMRHGTSVQVMLANVDDLRSAGPTISTDHEGQF